MSRGRRAAGSAAVSAAAVSAVAVLAAACSSGSGGGAAAPAVRGSQAPPTYRVSGGPEAPPLNQEGQVVLSTQGTGATARLPTGFPLPPGHGTPQVSARDAATDARLSILDPGRAYNYWVTALKHIGFTIGAHSFAAGSGSIAATGLGYRDATVTVSGRTATVHLLR